MELDIVLKRSSLVWTLALAFFVTTFLTLLLSGTVMLQSAQTQLLEEAENNLRRHTESISRLMGSHMDQVALTPEARARLTTEMVRLSEQLSGRMCIVNWKGEVLEDSEPEQEQQLLHRPEVYEALNGRYGRAERDGYLYLALPMTAKGNTVGCIYSSRPLAEIENTLTLLRSELVTAGSWALLLSLLLSLGLGAFFTRPLSKLADGVSRISKGEYDHRLKLKRTDELGQLAREVDVMAARLDEHRQTLMRFVADASHELKTPIASLKALSEALSDGAAEDPERRERFLSLAQSEIERMEHLVSQLLTLQRGEADHLNLEDFSALELVDGCLKSFEERMNRVDPKLELNGLMLRADRAKLERVFFNLVDNALTAMSQQEKPMLSISGESNQSEVVLRIEDNGPGVEPEELERIFQRFYRCDKDRSRQSGGSGLGLAICRQIVNQHGGTLKARSEPGKGACFVLTLPVKRPGED